MRKNKSNSTTVGVVRPLKHGGCSICRASEENVGKKRCQHILSNVGMYVVEKQRGMSLINIEGDEDDIKQSFSMKATENTIREYITNLSSGLSKEEKEEILQVLRTS